MIPGGMLQFDMNDGFPIITTKKVNFKAIAAELCGFLRGYMSAADFRSLGTKIWDANANKNETWLKSLYRTGKDDLGRIYGAQWRTWHGGDRTPDANVDQLYEALLGIMHDPTSRRIIVTAWNPSELKLMALPPCHLLWQVLIEQNTHRLHLCMYQRSCDMFLGVPFNISSYALLLHLLSITTGYQPGTLTMFLADVHVYENHFEQVDEQLKRQPKALPYLQCTKQEPTENSALTRLQWLETILPKDLTLINYDYWPELKAPMAV